ncbi:MAG: transcriptional regulator [Gammaproteobacteria bacterium]|nr:transcriptional regulator [Gammaproteobacteria bacterium]MDE0246828.1 transcriptional regulator [Gammaproteobacteria bacterium]
MRILRIGIAGYDRMKARTLGIARGEHTPTRGEPKVWVASIDRFAKLLSGHNRRLLALIAREHPRSLTEFAKMAGRSPSNLSRTLKKTMSQYGLVELRRGEERGRR